ncbi:MAG: Uma2 family endonuclease [Planctomycetota bacterium]|nr:Uma2 family endonuclease [Planctomycetaceae bacterium]MDQ3329519.1 Uma2 family endonuclease [Planctomycetota bacterium]
MPTVAVRRYSVEEYLSLEHNSEAKHEFYNGEIFAMAGASEPHNLVAGNIVTSLNIALRERECRVYPSDMRVRIPSGLYTYPDATVVCGAPDVEEYRGLETLKNPLLIVEVLSKSTEGYDRDAKFDFYKSIPSLKGYLLVSQDKPKADHLSRRDDGWLLSSALGLDASICIPELEVTLALVEIYAKVEFPPVDEATPFTPESEITPHPGDRNR